MSTGKGTGASSEDPEQWPTSAGAIPGWSAEPNYQQFTALVRQ